MQARLRTGVTVFFASGLLHGIIAIFAAAVLAAATAAADVLCLEGVEELAVGVRALHDLVLVGRAVPLLL